MGSYVEACSDGSYQEASKTKLELNLLRTRATNSKLPAKLHYLQRTANNTYQSTLDWRHKLQRTIL